MASLSLICLGTQRLPTCLTGIALRVETFTVTQMSSRRWLIDIPKLSQEDAADLITVLPAVDIDIHLYTP